MGRPRLPVPVGERFGRIVVLGEASPRPKSSYWLVKCDCGKEAELPASSIHTGSYRSCGCNRGGGKGHPRLSVPVGERFGHLEVVGPGPSRGNSRWLCRCDCGTEKTVDAQDLRKGGTRSCGCQRGNRKHGHARKGERHPLYGTWKSLRQRCKDPNCHAYPNYGGRPGNPITVCSRWDSDFAAFLEDMGEKPEWATGGIDRIDNDGGYWCGHCEECQREGRPANCRWATREQQAANKRRAA